MASGVRYRILYWEAADFVGIKFFDEDVSKKDRRSTPGPGICCRCEGIVDAHKFRMDNMQSSLRMCIGPDGDRFREEIVDFVLLSPWMCIEYNLRQFQRYNAIRGVHHLTEQSVIGTAMRVHRGEVDSRLSGVEVSNFDENGPDEWLHSYVQRVRKAADRASGISVGLMLDNYGVEVGSFGQTVASFAHSPEQPIREVVVLLGGPKGIEPQVLPKLLAALEKEPGLHADEVMRMKLPGGKQHSYVALGDLLSSHDSGYLVPIMEDYRSLGGRNNYLRWHHAMSEALVRLASASGGLKEKREMLVAFRESVKAAVRHSKRRRTDRKVKARDDGSEEGEDSAADARHTRGPGKTAGAGATPRDVDLLLSGLEQRGVLARPRPWRARQCIEAVEPSRAIAALRRLERSARRALAAGAPLEDPWSNLADIIDSDLAETPAEPDATPLAVKVELMEAGLPGACRKGAAALRILPCRDALTVIRTQAKKQRIASTDWAAEVELHLARLEDGPDVAMKLKKEALGGSKRQLSRTRSGSEVQRDRSRRTITRTTSYASLPKSLWAVAAPAPEERGAADDERSRPAGEQVGKGGDPSSTSTRAAKGEERGPGGAANGGIDTFVSDFVSQLDEDSFQALMRQCKDGREIILEDCANSRRSIRNPSAFVIAAIKRHREELRDLELRELRAAAPEAKAAALGPKPPSGPPPAWLMAGAAQANSAAQRAPSEETAPRYGVGTATPDALADPYAAAQVGAPGPVPPGGAVMGAPGLVPPHADGAPHTGVGSGTAPGMWAYPAQPGGHVAPEANHGLTEARPRVSRFSATPPAHSAGVQPPQAAQGHEADAEAPPERRMPSRTPSYAAQMGQPRMATGHGALPAAFARALREEAKPEQPSLGAPRAQAAAAPDEDAEGSTDLDRLANSSVSFRTKLPSRTPPPPPPPAPSAPDPAGGAVARNKAPPEPVRPGTPWDAAGMDQAATQVAAVTQPERGQMFGAPGAAAFQPRHPQAPAASEVDQQQAAAAMIAAGAAAARPEHAQMFGAHGAAALPPRYPQGQAVSGANGRQAAAAATARPEHAYMFGAPGAAAPPPRYPQAPAAFEVNEQQAAAAAAARAPPPPPPPHHLQVNQQQAAAAVAAAGGVAAARPEHSQMLGVPGAATLPSRYPQAPVASQVNEQQAAAAADAAGFAVPRPEQAQLSGVPGAAALPARCPQAPTAANEAAGLHPQFAQAHAAPPDAAALQQQIQAAEEAKLLQQALLAALDARGEQGRRAAEPPASAADFVAVAQPEAVAARMVSAEALVRSRLAQAMQQHGQAQAPMAPSAPAMQPQYGQAPVPPSAQEAQPQYTHVPTAPEAAVLQQQYAQAQRSLQHQYAPAQTSPHVAAMQPQYFEVPRVPDAPGTQPHYGQAPAVPDAAVFQHQYAQAPVASDTVVAQPQYPQGPMAPGAPAAQPQYVQAPMAFDGFASQHQHASSQQQSGSWEPAAYSSGAPPMDGTSSSGVAWGFGEIPPSGFPPAFDPQQQGANPVGGWDPQHGVPAMSSNPAQQVQPGAGTPWDPWSLPQVYQARDEQMAPHVAWAGTQPGAAPGQDLQAAPAGQQLAGVGGGQNGQQASWEEMAAMMQAIHGGLTLG